MSVKTVNEVLVPQIHTWRPDHPHAKDKQWTIDGKVWSWRECCGAGCSAKTAAAGGATGKPMCDECFEKWLRVFP